MCYPQQQHYENKATEKRLQLQQPVATGSFQEAKEEPKRRASFISTVIVIKKLWVVTAIKETTEEVVVDEEAEDSDPTVTGAGELAADMAARIVTISPKH